jgi:hypothetical protein
VHAAAITLYCSAVVKHAALGRDLFLFLQDSSVMNLVKNTTFFNRLCCIYVLECVLIQYVINLAFYSMLCKVSLERL